MERSLFEQNRALQDQLEVQYSAYMVLQRDNARLERELRESKSCVNTLLLMIRDMDDELEKLKKLVAMEEMDLRPVVIAATSEKEEQLGVRVSGGGNIVAIGGTGVKNNGKLKISRNKMPLSNREMEMNETENSGRNSVLKERIEESLRKAGLEGEFSTLMKAINENIRKVVADKMQDLQQEYNFMGINAKGKGKAVESQIHIPEENSNKEGAEDDEEEDEYPIPIAKLIQKAGRYGDRIVEIGSPSKSNLVPNSPNEELKTGDKRKELDIGLDNDENNSNKTKKKKENEEDTSWTSATEMIRALSSGNHTEKLLEAFCVLNRLESAEGTTYYGSSHDSADPQYLDTVSGLWKIADFLTGGDNSGPVIRTAEELQQHYPNGLQNCLQIVTNQANKLFHVYSEKLDPYFL